MTRARKYDPELLEREYIYDSATPPISLTGLSERYGLARSGVAEKALKGRWFERRTEFRQQLGVKTVEALGEKWVGMETATREKMMTVGLEYLDKYAAALDDGTIKVSTRDMLGIAAMIRTLIGDSAKATPAEEALIDPDATDLQPDDYRRALATIEQIESGIAADERDDVAEPEATGTTGPRSI